MSGRWEYLTVAFRLVAVRERRSPYFSHRALYVDLDEEGQRTLAALGRDGWELTGVVPVTAIAGGGAGTVVAFFKRPLADAPLENAPTPNGEGARPAPPAAEPSAEG